MLRCQWSSPRGLRAGRQDSPGREEADTARPLHPGLGGIPAIAGGWAVTEPAQVQKGGTGSTSERGGVLPRQGRVVVAVLGDDAKASATPTLPPTPPPPLLGAASQPTKNLALGSASGDPNLR